MAKNAGSRGVIFISFIPMYFLFSGTSLAVDFQNMVALTSAAEYRFLLWDLE